MSIRGQHHVGAKCSSRIRNAFVIGRDYDPVDMARFAASFPDVLNERLTANRVEGLAREPRRTISSRNDDRGLSSHFDNVARRWRLRADLSPSGASGTTRDKRGSLRRLQNVLGGREEIFRYEYRAIAVVNPSVAREDKNRPHPGSASALHITRFITDEP